MGIGDFLRWMQPGMMFTLGGLVLVFFGAWLFLSAPEIEDDVKGIIRRVRKVLVAILFVIFVWQIFAGAAVNVTPRAVIDRTDVNRQIDHFEDRASDANPNAH